MTLVARHGALTDIGLHRKTNEDAFVVQPPLYAVCDGMGGANAGEVASGLAAETLAAEVAAGTPLHAAAEAANAAVFQRAHDNVEQTGHGHDAHGLPARGRHGPLRPHRRQPRLPAPRRRAAAGERRPLARRRDGARRPPDRRRGGRPPAPQHPQPRPRHRAPGAQIDEFTEDLLPGDVLLLCSDGLSGPVAADAIRLALTRSDPQAAAERLILEARRQGGPDNITAVVVRVDEGPHGAEDNGDHAGPAGRPRGRRGHRRAAVRRRLRRA